MSWITKNFFCSSREIRNPRDVLKQIEFYTHNLVRKLCYSCVDELFSKWIVETLPWVDNS